jgi:hypothetical protein
MSRGPDEIPDAKWQAVEVPGLLKAKLPGASALQTQNVAGVPLVMKLCTPDKDSMYAISYTDGDLPPHRRAMSPDALLNDSCNGSVAGSGGKEVSRESISLAGFPGRQLVIDVPKGNGKIVSRIYLVNGRLVTVMAGGRGMEPDNANVRKLFASLELLAPPAGGDPR